MKVRSYGRTDVGVIRSNNEDAYGIFTLKDGGKLFVVADGLGGHLAGEVASSTAVKRLKEYLEEVPGDFPQLLKDVFRRLNREIYSLGQSNPSRKGMGTTLTALFMKGDDAYIAHVGDSRVYRIRDGAIELLTQDQSFVEKLVSDGLLSEEEAKRHPRKNVLLQMIGMKREVEPQIIGPFKVREGDLFLLCTDGLSNLVMDREILEVFSRLPLQEAVNFLIDLAKKRGGPDNITAIGVGVGEEKAEKEDSTPLESTPVEMETKEFGKSHKFQRRRKVALIIALVLILLFILGFGYYLFSLGKKEEKLEKLQNPQVTVQEKRNDRKDNR